ncbi:hypothetical protein JY651_07510 [Pyxidicoccus parkwayensis]|uniref:Lipoprotein n=1 Tax=Pyxidicoccus parkwayensis TaxID=2813578 RepID=A0ABX7P2V2_9BACT|nr:hypothetical protein [Pyxidicoccus parkwaysis]QSQ24781.1 hypothetical protein JY651_07510 [Pyxidicoccus parkwaysis]
MRTWMFRTVVSKVIFASAMWMATGCGGGEDALTGAEAPAVQEDVAVNAPEGGDVRAFACSSTQVVTSGFYPQEWVYITGSMTTNSGCGHIALQNYISGRCTMARVRYFPSNGGPSFTSAYMNVCGTWAYFTVDVLAGTQFWIESPTQNAQFWVSR